MPHNAKVMGVITVAGLVLVTAYSSAMGSSGWLWLGWVVLVLVTAGMLASRT